MDKTSVIAMIVTAIATVLIVYLALANDYQEKIKKIEVLSECIKNNPPADCAWIIENKNRRE